MGYMISSSVDTENWKTPMTITLNLKVGRNNVHVNIGPNHMYDNLLYLIVSLTQCKNVHIPMSHVD